MVYLIRSGWRAFGVGFTVDMILYEGTCVRDRMEDLLSIVPPSTAAFELSVASSIPCGIAAPMFVVNLRSSLVAVCRAMKVLVF